MLAFFLLLSLVLGIGLAYWQQRKATGMQLGHFLVSKKSMFRTLLILGSYGTGSTRSNQKGQTILRPRSLKAVTQVTTACIREVVLCRNGVSKLTYKVRIDKLVGADITEFLVTRTWFNGQSEKVCSDIGAATKLLNRCVLETQSRGYTISTDNGYPVSPSTIATVPAILDF